MGEKSGENLGPELPADNGNAYRVDLRGAVATVVGDNATQVNVFYNGTYSDGVAPPPLISGQGTIASPYRGLNAFEEQDAGLFFGREDATAEALELISERLQRSGLLVISGVSGAGKSSLLRAGMLPELRRAGLFEPRAAQAMLQRHLNGEADLRKPLWTLAMFQLWQRKWGERASALKQVA